jgi:hypothetical protein
MSRLQSGVEPLVENKLECESFDDIYTSLMLCPPMTLNKNQALMHLYFSQANAAHPID